MGGHKKTEGIEKSRKEAHTINLNQMLSFGPEKPHHEEQNTLEQSNGERLKKLLKELKDLNGRVDKITQRY